MFANSLQTTIVGEGEANTVVCISKTRGANKRDAKVIEYPIALKACSVYVAFANIYISIFKGRSNMIGVLLNV